MKSFGANKELPLMEEIELKEGLKRKIMLANLS